MYRLELFDLQRARAFEFSGRQLTGLDLGFLALGFQRFALDFGELLLS